METISRKQHKESVTATRLGQSFGKGGGGGGGGGGLLVKRLPTPPAPAPAPTSTYPSAPTAPSTPAPSTPAPPPAAPPPPATASLVSVYGISVRPQTFALCIWRQTFAEPESCETNKAN